MNCLEVFQFLVRQFSVSCGRNDIGKILIICKNDWSVSTLQGGVEVHDKSYHFHSSFEYYLENISLKFLGAIVPQIAGEAVRCWVVKLFCGGKKVCECLVSGDADKTCQLTSLK